MSLADCLKRINIHPSDAEAIGALVDNGMAEDVAIQQQLKSIGAELSDIANAVKEQGGNVAVNVDADGISYNQETGQANIDTPEFENWFGDSKVVDDDGEPLVVYHGTDASITEFDNAFLGMNTMGNASDPAYGSTSFAGFWFNTGEIKEAENSPYSNYIEAYVSVENPRYFDNLDELASELGGVIPSEYDDTMEVKDAVKLWVAEQEQEGYDGIALDDEEFGGMSYVAFSPTQIKSVNNQGTFDPNDPRILYQDGKKQPPGSITFPEVGLGSDQTTIKLFENANLSTFLHESAHYFLEFYRTVADQQEPGQKAYDDLAKLHDWFGTKDIGRKQHEQLARGFEAYLFEGKAPSIELQGVFSRYRAWMINIYRKLPGLNVTLTNEVRDVFDRMLATQDAIQEAEQQLSLLPAFDANNSKELMTEAEFKAYQEGAQKAHEASQIDLERQAMDELRRVQREEWRTEFEKVRQKVAAEYAEMPNFQAKEYLMHSRFPNQEGLPEGLEPAKLSRAALVQMYGDDTDALWRKLPFGKNSVWRKDDGSHPDDIAIIFGFETGHDLVQSIIETPSFKAAVAAEAARRMKAKHGDMLNNADQMAQKAVEAVHGDARASYLHTELRALEKRTGGQTARQTIKLAAARIVSGQTVGRIRAYSYLRDETKHAKEAQRAVANGDFQLAADHKRKQILNHYLFREATNAKQEAEKTQRYFTKFSKEGTRKNLDRSYLDQIDAILEAYDFKKSVSLKEIERRNSLSAWIEEQEEQGLEVIVPKDLIEKARRRSYKDLTVEEMRGLRDSVKNIEHIARFKQKLLDRKAKRDLDQTAKLMNDTAKENNKWHDDPPPIGDGAWRKTMNWKDQFLAEHKKAEFVFQQLDGNKANGIWWNTVFRPIAEAEDAELEMQAETVVKLRALHDNYTPEERRGWYSKKLNTKDLLGRDFTKNEILAIALNVGNEGNLQALLNGSRRYLGRSSEIANWSPEQVQQALHRHMTEKDWQFVQGTWDMIDEFWPQIAALQKEMTGVVPEKVERTPVVTQFGTIEGGYYPLKYDSRLSDRAFVREQKQSTEDLFGTSYIKPATKKGHTVERVGSAGQAVQLSLDVIGEHVSQVIHDLTHRKALLQADKVLRHPAVKEAITATAGTEVYRTMRPWLTYIANAQRPPADSLEKFIGHIRRNTTVVNMGWKTTTGIVQPLGYLQTVELLGEKYSGIGLGKFYAHPIEMKDMVFEKSVMMRNRAKNFDREVKDTVKQFKRSDRLYQLEQTWLWHIGFMDLTVSLPSWVGAYEKGIAENMSDKDAIAYADSVVRMSQGAAGAKDLANIQQGHELKKAFTMFYSYFNALHNLMVRRGKMTAQEGIRATPKAMMSFVYLIMLPAVLSEMITGRWDWDDEPEEQLKKAVTLVVAYPFQTMVGMRDLVNGIVSDYGYSMTPVGNALEMITRGSGELAEVFTDDEFTKSDAKAMTMAAGYIFGLPARQIWITGEGLYDVLIEGEDMNLSEMLLTPPRK